MRLLKLSTILTAVLISLASCVEEVKLKPLEGETDVVNCMLTNYPIQELYLYKLKPYYNRAQNEYEPIKDATVGLYIHSRDENGKKDSTLVGNFVYKENRKWELDYTAETKRTYSLVVENNGKTIYAKTVMPDSIRIGYTTILATDFAAFRQVVTPRISNRADWFLPGYLLYCNTESTVWICGSDSEGNLTPLISTSHNNADKFNAVSEKLTKFYYTANGSFADYSNITPHEVSFNYYQYYVRITHSPYYTNRLLYFFYANALTEDILKDLLVKPTGKNDVKRYLGDDGGLWGAEFMLEGDSNTSGYTFMNVSTELDLYLSSGIRTAIDKPTGDFTELFDNENPYTNINNGTGIFGATFIARRKYGTGI